MSAEVSWLYELAVKPGQVGSFSLRVTSGNSRLLCLHTDRLAGNGRSCRSGQSPAHRRLPGLFGCKGSEVGAQVGGHVDRVLI